MRTTLTKFLEQLAACCERHEQLDVVHDPTSDRQGVVQFSHAGSFKSILSVRYTVETLPMGGVVIIVTLHDAADMPTTDAMQLRSSDGSAFDQCLARIDEQLAQRT